MMYLDSNFNVEESEEHSTTTTHITQGCLVVPVQMELTKTAAQKIQKSILAEIHGKKLRGVIIDLSGVKIIDSVLWEIFSKTSTMIRMLGLSCVITGLNPGVVASIIDLNIDTDSITTELDLESALEILTQDEVINSNDSDDVGTDDDITQENDDADDSYASV